MAPQLDQSIYALVTDLHQRGLADDVGVVVWGEMGRTPRVGTQRGTVAGRDHWPQSGFALLAGGGLEMGQVIGATDKDNVKVTDRPISVPDLFCTFCKVLGLNPHDEYFTELNQPLKLVEGGEAIKELF